MEKLEKEYWNHNTAYHRWIARRASGSVLDVGCGDGLLLARLAPTCAELTGIEPDADAASRAERRLNGIPHAAVIRAGFPDYPFEGRRFDTVIFAASLHHMEEKTALTEAAELLNPGGRLLVVGLAKPAGFSERLLEALRVVPAKIGSVLHGERRHGPADVPVAEPRMSLGEIRRLCAVILPGARLRPALYYRYLLEWRKP